MSEIDILKDLEREGYFEQARNGDHRACGLFARLAAYKLNPAGDPAGWGCLRKTGGGANVEGYSEDAIVFGNDQSNVTNVVDIIVGAGQPGASLGWGVWRPGTDQRRSSDVWERPRMLTSEQMYHLRPNGEPVPPPVPIPVPVPPPAQTCRYQAINLEGIVTILERLHADVREMRAELADLTARLEQGAVIDANAKYLGAVRGTVRLPPRQE